MTPPTEREAHISSALGLRQTAHKWLRMAKDWPKDAERCIAEARRLLNYARWDLAMVRRIDNWDKWRAK